MRSIEIHLEGWAAKVVSSTTVQQVTIHIPPDIDPVDNVLYVYVEDHAGNPLDDVGDLWDDLDHDILDRVCLGFSEYIRI